MTRAKTTDFIAPQREHAENKKLGSLGYYGEFCDGKYESGYRRRDAKTNPPIVDHIFSYGQTRGVEKPGK